MSGAAAEVPPLPELLYEDVVRRALREDLGRAGDLTSDAVVPPGRIARARIVARSSGRMAGLPPALLAFRLLDPAVMARVRRGDGADVESGEEVAAMEGEARALLAAERTALNLLGRLSGIATATRGLVEAVAGLPAAIVCTRKTTPGLRALEKHAVRLGGGRNHRFGLDDAVLVKDGHRRLAGGVRPAVQRVRAAVGHLVKIEVEVETLDELDEALELGVEAVLLDNMSLADLRRAVERARGRALLEASGGITPETAREVAATGVHLLSAGWLTHSAPALDVAFEIDPD